MTSFVSLSIPSTYRLNCWIKVTCNLVMFVTSVLIWLMNFKRQIQFVTCFVSELLTDVIFHYMFAMIINNFLYLFSLNSLISIQELAMFLYEQVTYKRAKRFTNNENYKKLWSRNERGTQIIILHLYIKILKEQVLQLDRN